MKPRTWHQCGINDVGMWSVTEKYSECFHYLIKKCHSERHIAMNPLRAGPSLGACSPQHLSCFCSGSELLFPECLYLCCHGCLDAVNGCKIFTFCDHLDLGMSWESQAPRLWIRQTRTHSEAFCGAGFPLRSTEPQQAAHFWSCLRRTIAKENLQNCFRNRQEGQDQCVQSDSFVFWGEISGDVSFTVFLNARIPCIF